MIRTTIFVLLAGCTLSSATLAAEFDPAAFVESNCTRCHDSSMYTRSNRRVNSLDRLHGQVAMCDANVGTKLFPEDIAHVTDYLNASYYHFPQ